MSEYLDKVKELASNQLGVEKEKITPQSSFVDDLGADSLDVVELVMAFEEEFGVDFDDQNAAEITTIQNAIDFIESLKKEG